VISFGDAQHPHEAKPVNELRVLEAGVANAVQDRGRINHRAIGVPVSGAADTVLLACANRLLGNADDAAGIEMPLMGPTLEAHDRPVHVAWAGAVQPKLVRADGSALGLQAHRGVRLQPGEQLRVGVVGSGVAYLAVQGGVLVESMLGSRSTYARAGLGGVQGRALLAGDALPCGDASHGDLIGTAFAHEQGPIRLLQGPQWDAFTAASWDVLMQTEWLVSRQSDRMGLRLQHASESANPNAKLQHLRSADICSEGVAPGSIQVPGDGLPIVLMVDAQTVGGYPKIASVIGADLPRLAHLRAGQRLRFAAVSLDEALAARAALAERFRAWTALLKPAPAVQDAAGSAGALAARLDEGALLSLNLISGMIDARST
jgi:5-oxoprolinase (ATP-hydrolysing) subunit C